MHIYMLFIFIYIYSIIWYYIILHYIIIAYISAFHLDIFPAPARPPTPRRRIRFQVPWLVRRRGHWSSPVGFRVPCLQTNPFSCIQYVYYIYIYVLYIYTVYVLYIYSICIILYIYICILYIIHILYIYILYIYIYMYYIYICICIIYIYVLYTYITCIYILCICIIYMHVPEGTYSKIPPSIGWFITPSSYTGMSQNRYDRLLDEHPSRRVQSGVDPQPHSHQSQLNIWFPKRCWYLSRILYIMISHDFPITSRFPTYLSFFGLL